MFSWEDSYIAYANLAHRQDRNNHMIQELARVGLEAERFESVNTKSEEWNREPYTVMYNRTRGAIGCMLSQMGIMKKAYELSKSAIVFEDDLIFASDIATRLYYIQDFINRHDVDVFFLGGTVHTDKAWWHGTPHEGILAPHCNCTLDKDYEQIDDEYIVRVYGMFSTHAYIIPYEKIPKILEILESTFPVTIGIDFSFIMHEPKLNCYAFLPGSVIQIDNKSDIGTGDTIFSGFKSLGDHWFRDKI